MSLLARLRLARARRACRLALQRELIEEPLPSAGTRFEDLETVALDFETTGLDPARDGVLAAGWVLMRGDRLHLGTARELRVQDDRPGGVGQSAVVHGILDSDLEGAGSIEELLGVLLPELSGRVVVAHAAAIERRFLAAMLRPLGGVPVPNPCIDTMAVERRLLESRGEHIAEARGDLTLDACRARHGLGGHSRHSAGADAIACAELLLAQVAAMGGADRVRLRNLTSR